MPRSPSDLHALCSASSQLGAVAGTRPPAAPRASANSSGAVARGLSVRVKTTSAWANYQANVSAYLGGSEFKVRFRFTTDTSVTTYYGPYINNVRLEF